jgi:hypothetical protein
LFHTALGATMLKHVIAGLSVCAVVPLGAINLMQAPAEHSAPVTRVVANARMAGAKSALPQCAMCYDWFSEEKGYVVHQFYSIALTGDDSDASADSSAHGTESPQEHLDEGSHYMSCSAFNACHGNEQANFCGQNHWKCEVAFDAAVQDLRVALETDQSWRKVGAVIKRHEAFLRVDQTLGIVEVADCAGEVAAQFVLGG